MSKKNLKLLYLNSFIISFIALVVGASFHNYRSHPENVTCLLDFKQIKWC